MNHFFVPRFIPKTLEELPPEADEVTALVYLEDSIAKELNAIRDYNKTAPPLGQPPQIEDTPSEVEDDGQTAEGTTDQDDSDFNETSSDDDDPGPDNIIT